MLHGRVTLHFTVFVNLLIFADNGVEISECGLLWATDQACSSTESRQ